MRKCNKYSKIIKNSEDILRANNRINVLNMKKQISGKNSKGIT